MPSEEFTTDEPLAGSPWGGPSDAWSSVSYDPLLLGPDRRIGCASVDADDEAIGWTL